MSESDDRDTVVYDDDCGFCTWWAQIAVDRTDLRVIGFSDLDDEERERLPSDWEDCVHLLTDDAVYSCGAATQEVLLRLDVTPPGSRELAEFLDQFADYRRVRERLYREVADRRDVWGRVVSADQPTRRE